MFKRRQYNKGSDVQITPAGGVYMPSVEAIGSAVGSGISAVVNQLGNPAVLAASQGIATNINKPPKEKPAQLPDYQVAAPRAVDRMSAGTTGAMAVQRMASGVGAHPGGAGRGKGAGGSLGQESRQAMKRKRLSKRIANRKAKGKDQIQISSEVLKKRDDYDYAEGGRVEYAEGEMVMEEMMEGPTHTMPDGTVMPGATHGEYEQGLAEGQAECMAQEGMVPDEQLEEDFVDYVIEITL